MNKKEKRYLFRKYIALAESGDEEALRIVRAVSENRTERPGKGRTVKVTFKSGVVKRYYSIAACSKHIKKSETAIIYCIDKGIIDSKGRYFEKIKEDE